MLKREAIRAVGYLLRRRAIDLPRMSFVLNSCNSVSVLETGHHDPMFFRGTTLYFDTNGKEITKFKFDRLQDKADAAEAFLHPQPSAAQMEMEHA